MNWEILDCTLRDGGYYTSWDFDEKLVGEYVNTIRDLPVRYIELGYRNPPQAGYAGKYYYISVSLLELLISSGIDVSRLGVMIDAKLVNPSDIKRLLVACKDRLGFIRLAVQPDQIDTALNIATEINNLGFTVGINLMYMHNQKDLMTAVMKLENSAAAVDWVSLVDSFGACFPEQVGETIKKVKSIIPHKIGFHGHDNLHLAFANTLAALAAGADIIDSTILGMGRGAGNLKTELLLIYWSKLSGNHLDLSDLGGLLEIFRSQLGHHDWGANLPYMISGIEALPQKDIMHWVGIRRYSTSTIIDKLRVGSALMPDLEPSGSPRLLSRIKRCNQPCLILGGGASVFQHANALKEFALRKECIIIHSSLKSTPAFSGVELKQYACLPGDEYRYLKKQDHDVLEGLYGFVICQGYNGKVKSQDSFFKKTYALANEETDEAESELDSPVSLSFRSALQLSLDRVFYLAGFDGYSHENVVEREIEAETQLVLDKFHSRHPEYSVTSITPTSYNIKKSSVYALLQNTAGISI